MKTFEIWVEGHRATGTESHAQLAGRERGETLNDAAARFFVGKEAEWGNFDPERLTIWGCRIFDNERDARKAFG